MMTEADLKFLADNMLTADDFDVSAFLMEEENLLSSITADLKFTVNNLPISNAHNSIGDVDQINTANFLDRLIPYYPNDSNMEVKVEPFSPSPSPAGSSSSGYSSPAWNEDLSTTEISISDSEVQMIDSPTIQYPETPPDTFHTPFNQPTLINAVPQKKLESKRDFQVSSHNATSKLFQTINGKYPIQPVKKAKLKEIPVKPTKQDKIHPLILTPEEFVKLTTTSGFLIEKAMSKNKSNSLGISYMERQTNVPVLPNKKSSTNKNLPCQTNQIVDDIAVKRQQRMIKNRESAYLSRKKKREYVQTLEHQISELSNEYNRIRQENSQLKEKISTLEEEIGKLKKLFSVKDLKKNTCLMVLLFMVTVNLAPFSGLISNGSTPAKLSEPRNPKLGRTLLWTASNPDVDELQAEFESKDDPGDLLMLSTDFLNSTACPTNVNKTESIRLENELRVWALRVEKQKEKRKQRRPSLKALRKQLMVPMPKLQNWMRASRINLKKQELNDLTPKGIELYHTTGLKYEDLFEALDRQDDTFYFVSFSGDHLLLPATAHNRTNRPKMSLVMPAMTLNDTLKSDWVTMMQIDCEVMNTKLVQLKESAIPTHMRHKINETNIKEHNHRNNNPPLKHAPSNYSHPKRNNN